MKVLLEYLVSTNVVYVSRNVKLKRDCFFVLVRYMSNENLSKYVYKILTFVKR